jgi:tRNA-splicing ligase RtcB (3'-phosphate/5'-hydroxy nucleic acid ligase)
MTYKKMVECTIIHNGEKKIIKIEPRKLNEYSYMIDKQPGMNVPVKIFADEKLIQKMMDDRCIAQGVHVACLPGIKGQSIMMPDAHQGYGFSIGGVAAIDTKTGCISPGGIGFDINCGVRVLQTNLTKEQVQEKIQPLLDTLFKNIPPGIGKKSNLRLSREELDLVLQNGPKWALEKNIGDKEFIENCEENGCLKDANPEKISARAKKRGIGQLGTIGSGNHFVEIQYVDTIGDEDTAKVFGITKPGQVTVMIHTGSRGLGHQTCSDFLRRMEEEFPEIVKDLPEKDLIYAPAQSQTAHDYYEAMCAAANYAWTNRHVIAHQVIKSFRQIFGEDVELHQIYDVAHNIAKKETHIIEGKECEVWVHRKGATRAFGPGMKELPEKYQKTGQPIFLPGSMGTASYILVGTDGAMKQSFGSTAHGAGRKMSRHAANKEWTGEQVKKDLEEKQHIYVKAASWKGISEEAPGAYKDVDEVVQVSNDAGIGKIVARLKPIGVIKG